MNSAAVPAHGKHATCVRRDGEVLVFAGALERSEVPMLWATVLPLADGAAAINLAGVTHVDSAGLALLAELQSRAAGGLTLQGEPDGLPGLRAAYRLDPALCA